MMNNAHPLPTPNAPPAPNHAAITRMGIVYWQPDDGIAPLFAAAFQSEGCQTIPLPPADPLPPDVQAVFVYGPFGSLVPLASQLRDMPPARRPLFILWITEQFPSPRLPEWLRYGIGVARSRLERLAHRQTPSGEWRIAPPLRWLTRRLHRFRYYGDLYWLREEGLLSLLVTGSQVTAQFLRARGFQPLVTVMGSAPEWSADLHLERDIPVLWLGKPGSRRRKKLIQRLRAELRQRGVEMLVVDGVEHPYVFGEARTRLLNRTRIVLNILREPWDNNAMRFYLAAPNRALIVSEPTLPHTPYTPGVHLVEAPLSRLADTICHYLAHPAEAEPIVERAYRLATEELTIQHAARNVLQHLPFASQSSIAGKSSP